MKRSLVSIGLPIYKSGNKITKVLQSLLNQKYKKIEIIISDNSQDNLTKKIIHKNFKSKKIKYFQNKKNLGSIFNHNKTLKKAEGEYFMWIHDVDSIDKNYISECIKILKKNIDHIAVMGRIKYIKNNLVEKIYKEPDFIENCKFKRLRKYLLSNYPDTLVCAIFRNKNNLNWKKIMSPEIPFILNLLIKGKISGAKKTHFNKGNDSLKTMLEVKSIYQANQKFLNNFKGRYGYFFLTISAISKLKIDSYKKFFLYLIFFLYNFPFLRFFFNKPYKY